MFSTQIINKTSNLNLSAVSISEKDLCGRLSNMKRRGSSPRIIPLIKKASGFHWWNVKSPNLCGLQYYSVLLLLLPFPLYVPSSVAWIIYGFGKKKLRFFTPHSYFLFHYKKIFHSRFPSLSGVWEIRGITDVEYGTKWWNRWNVRYFLSESCPRPRVPGISIRDWPGI